MWSEVVAWEVSENGVPTITEPWPVKDVGFLRLKQALYVIES
jgi:hypothetical protein